MWVGVCVHIHVPFAKVLGTGARWYSLPFANSGSCPWLACFSFELAVARHGCWWYRENSPKFLPSGSLNSVVGMGGVPHKVGTQGDAAW